MSLVTGALIGLDRAAADGLLPMHLLMTREGVIRSVGPTLRKVVAPGLQYIDAAFENGRPGSTGPLVPAILSAADRAERLFLRMRQPPGLNLRGHAVPASDDLVLMNLGFGIGLTDAVGFAGLTDRDFAPPELAMELLFMREAVGGVLGELSHFNSQLEAAREAAEIQAHTDPLTGLCNRRGLELALAAARREPTLRGRGLAKPEFALAHLDLDDFKQVNDRLGHAAGDAVLCHVAQVLREVTRSDDTAARVGGDEFVLLLQGLEDEAILHRLARRIITGIEAALADETDSCAVSASLGIVLSRNYRDAPVARMLADADGALYRSKRAGKGRVTILTGPSGDPG
ncbi:GGDEF domain-containing protein [Paracoccus spongiarum]|uniref:diguanylate cyclase n=1 Tax=Paracoccus spongiarum TaxID=3064387 RepID=A0ABT9JBK4_9RHOB|nr:GGDEF domain-containing protein [Paracoccus sp. 2205BS29-5]MDP5307208.1 GGDEF domain-containing protein [Paracoccus sp. 2205BS29-5]